MKLLTGFESERDRKSHSDASGFACVGDSMTVQAHAEDADINVIMKRFAKHGTMPGLARLPSYGDFEGITDFREALHAVRDAEDQFMSLPPQLRAKFENDPQQFLEFVSGASREQLVELGIASPEAIDAYEKERAAAARSSSDLEGDVPGAASRRRSQGDAAPPSRRQPGRGRNTSADPAEGGEDH